MDPEHVLACQFARWYTGFQHVTFRSRVIDLPDQFIDYLLQDGVHLPATSPAVSRQAGLIELYVSGLRPVRLNVPTLSDMGIVAC